jgi:dTDP-4-dehydrorhamnose 3,5-epimerase
MSKVFQEVNELNIPGVYEIVPRIFSDNRGSFVKTYHDHEYKKLGLESDFKEEFYSISQKNVIRGFHFQKPPMDHVKLVYCLQGEVLDVLVDLRQGSPVFGKVISINLNYLKANILYIPKGIGHAFLSLEDSSVMVYKTTTVHSIEHDSGVRWDSVDFEWPTATPVISEKDINLISFSDFSTPF